MAASGNGKTPSRSEPSPSLVAPLSFFPGGAGGAAEAQGGVFCDHPINGPLEHFENMTDTCLQAAEKAKAAGKPIVGIMCEFTPRELILAAGGLPICLCGGDADMIPPAEQDLPSGLCPLIKSTYGYHKEGTNPFLEMADLIVAETTCDGKKKMYELMSQTRPMYVLELPQKPDQSDSLDLWVLELKKFRQFLQARFGPFTDQAIRKAAATMNVERRLRHELAETMRAENPPMTGRQLLEFKSSVSCLGGDLEQYEAALAACQYQPGPSAAGEPSQRVRVLMTGVPMVRGAERVLEIIEDRGGLVVCQENCTGIKPIWEDVNVEAPDIMRALGEKYFHLSCSVMTPNNRRTQMLRELVAQYRPQCIIELVWTGCLTYDVESWRISRLAQDELHLPYLKIQTDYSPSDSQRIALRVEALFETIRGA